MGFLLAQYMPLGRSDELMKPTNEEIYNALSVIIEECVNNARCSECPLRVPFTQDRCYLKNEIPDNWVLNKPDDWRAFNV